MFRIDHRRLVTRSAAVVALLALAIAATAALSWEAMRSSRLARETAEGVLRDYAAFAAAQFARESEMRLDTRVANSLAAARHKIEGHPNEPPGAMQRKSPDDCDCPAGANVVTTFAVAAGGPVVVEGQPLADDVVAMLRAEVQAGADSLREHVRVLDGGGIIATSFGRRNGDFVVLGVVTSEAQLTEVFTRVAREATLLPPTLVDKARARDMLAVRVFDNSGRQRFASSQESSPFTGSTTMSPRLGGMRVEIAIPPRHAEQLVIGGLPLERAPLAIGLLVLAAGLVVAAVVQLRRELRFARQRADFVAGVSHELRTPLAQIRLFGETLLLRRVRTPEEEQHAAAVIVQESRRLSQMVDNVLQFSRSGRGMVAVRPETIDDVGAVIREIVETFRSQAASKDVAIRLEAGELPASMAIDPNALRQILLNLLDNAVKYGPRGQTVRVAASARDGRLQISVEDEGPGISDAEAAQVWEPFWRKPGSSEGGTGLGLAIVRELVTLHGGTVAIEPGRARGARFIVDLAAPSAPDAAAGAADPAGQPA